MQQGVTFISRHQFRTDELVTRVSCNRVTAEVTHCYPFSHPFSHPGMEVSCPMPLSVRRVRPPAPGERSRHLPVHENILKKHTCVPLTHSYTSLCVFA